MTDKIWAIKIKKFKLIEREKVREETKYSYVQII